MMGTGNQLSPLFNPSAGRGMVSHLGSPDGKDVVLIFKGAFSVFPDPSE
jgi:hypothetical protein